MTVAVPDNHTPWLHAQAARIDALQGYERNAALLQWARYLGTGAIVGLCQDDLGRITREASAVFAAALAKDTPGKAWADADPAVGRASIARLSDIEGHPAAWYATLPFRTLRYDDRDWIAAAVGSERLLAWKQQDAGHRWCHLDITDVILWDPLKNEARIMGEHPSSPRIVTPARRERLAVYAAPDAFFSAWAARRIEALVHHQSMTATHGALDYEDSHNEMPGALIVGDIGRATWPACDAAQVAPAAGCDPDALRDCIMRSAGLPTILTRKRARG